MLFLLFGKPLIFWTGILAFILLISQIFLGIAMMRGRLQLLPYHKVNAFALLTVVITHALLALGLYL